MTCRPVQVPARDTARHVTDAVSSAPQSTTARQRQLGRRPLNAEDALKTAYAETGRDREHTGRLLRQIRDMERACDDETTQHLAAENTTLRQRVRQLSQDNHSADEKLKAARSNNRFLDKRIAALEAQLLETQPP